MPPPECHSARELQGLQRDRFCAHPSVHSRGQIVSAEMCRICGFRTKPPPEWFRDVPDYWSLERHERPRSVAVIIPCHNYGRYLAECIESVLLQTHQPAEIVVVDDASTDETAEVAAEFKNRGVRYLSVNVRHPLLARYAGFEATGSEVLCFLDADDCLSRDYLRKGLARFDSPNVGIVYSDMETFGSATGKREFPVKFSLASLERENFIHAGSLVRREPIQIVGAFDVHSDRQVPAQTADWFLWRRIARAGWTAKKQSALYRYRRHGESMTGRNRARSYFDLAFLAGESVTLFIPLSGRRRLWGQLARYLERQAWPHEQTHLYLLDTSGSEAFQTGVRKWLAQSDYRSFTLASESVGANGLAERPRLEAADEVRVAVARIYNRMARTVATPFVWVLEDDIVPPDDACEQLLRGFDPQTFSVSGVYASRFHSGCVAWDLANNSYRRVRRGLERVGGNGFGCVVLRTHVFDETVFTASGSIPDFDHAFYARIQGRGLHAKIDWSVRCRHYDADGRCHEPVP